MKPECIITCVSNYFEISPESLSSKSRVSNIAEARHIATYLIHEKCYQLSLSQIGVYTKRDHATVLHSCQRVSEMLNIGDKKMVRELREIRDDLATFYGFCDEED